MFFCKDEFGLFGGIMMIYEFFVDVHKTCLDSWTFLQDQFFRGYYVTLGVYNKDSQRFIKIYDHRSFLSTLYVIMKSCFVEKERFLIPLDFSVSLKGHNWIVVSAFFNGSMELQYNITYPLHNLQEQVDFSIVYCTVNEVICLTHELESFKHCFVDNEELCTQDVVNILCSVHGRKNILLGDGGLKVVKDDTFDEIIFKGDHVFKLYNGQ